MDNVLDAIVHSYYKHENKSIWSTRVVFRLEFDGDICFCVAPSKSTFLLMFADLFDAFRNLFVFGVFVKFWIWGYKVIKDN